MKKLIPAIGMTLLGAALLGTSTYAWFSANKTVTATGMNLQAKADSSLLISNNGETDFSNTMKLENDVTGAETFLTPVRESFSSSDGTYSFLKLTETGKTFVQDDGKFVGPLIDDPENEGQKIPAPIENYLEAATTSHYHDSMWLKYDMPYDDAVAPTKELVMAATMSSNSSEAIFKAFRIAIVDVANKTVVDTFKFDSYTKVTSTKKVSITVGTAKQLDVYAWVAGDDTANCFNANATKGHTYNVDLEFSIPSDK